MRLSDRDKADLCFGIVTTAAVYAILVIAARGMALGWW